MNDTLAPTVGESGFAQAGSAGSIPDVSSEKELLACWMIEHGFATGHGDSVADLLSEMSWQVKEHTSHVAAEITKLHMEIDRLNVKLKARAAVSRLQDEREQGKK